MGSDNESAIDFLEGVSYAADYAVIGPKDNRVHEIRTRQFPFNTICHIERDFGDGVWRGCSATLISPRIVLSAGHCLYNHRLRRAPVRIRVTPGRSDRDTAPYGSVVAQRYYAPARYIAGPAPDRPDWRDFDYGVIVLPRAFAGISRFMELRALSSAEIERLRHRRLVTIAGYPADRPVGTLWRHSELLARVSPRRIFYTVDTCPGHSGSPVWMKDGERRSIVGVHTAGPVDESGRAYGCSQGTVLAPPGMMNSGVRITPEVLADIRDPERAVAGARRMTRLP
jgi:V8-like Glu-specific endopeptidase